MSADDAPSGSAAPGVGGRNVVRLNVVGTLVIVAAGVVGLASTGAAQGVLAPVSGVMAVVGIVGFTWSYLYAVNRSRQHEISVSQLYFAAGSVAPRPVKRALQGSLAAQIAVAVVVMVVGFSQTEPQEFNWAACIIVTPLFGMGMTGIWVARFGSFGPRLLTQRARRTKRSARQP